MIVLTKKSFETDSNAMRDLLSYLNSLPAISATLNPSTAPKDSGHQIHLTGDVSKVDVKALAAMSSVEQVMTSTPTFKAEVQTPAPKLGFEYKGLRFDQDSFHVFAGLNAVDSRESVDKMLACLSRFGLECTRMGAYKPRTSPYSFQGLGKACLDYVFDLAGHYGIKVIAMEVTHERQLDEIQETLERLGHPTGVMLQIGTRNAQNFELLKAVGSQTRFPILYKRGFGITLDESLSAAEYLTHAGNQKVIFCLRGMKTVFAAPHRNMVDFGHVPVIKRMTHMPVCIDPSHSVGTMEIGPDGISDVFHTTAQGVIAGANMVLVDFHPDPSIAAVDAKQAISTEQLGWYMDDIMICRQAYEKRKMITQ